MASPALLDHFSALDDPRQPGKVLYPLTGEPFARKDD